MDPFPAMASALNSYLFQLYVNSLLRQHGLDCDILSAIFQVHQAYVWVRQVGTVPMFLIVDIQNDVKRT